MIYKNISRRQGEKVSNMLNLKITTVALPNFTSQLDSPKEISGSQPWVFIGITWEL